ncbi:MAG: CatB-related O-acetyltransferase [Pseudomonadota bacterium]
MKLTLTKAQADLLQRLKITKYHGAAFAPYPAGAVVAVRPGSIVEAFTRHPPGKLMQMGAFSYANDNPFDKGLLQVGRYGSVAIGLRVLEGHHPLEAVTTGKYFYGPFYKAGNIPDDYVYRAKTEPIAQTYGPIDVGHDVWISAHCTIKAGVRIGHGAVIAGGANVVKDVEPYAIVGGNPAKRIRFRHTPKLRARLLALAWWDISPRILRDLNMQDPPDFCTRLERMRAEGELIPFTPAKVQVTQTGQFEVIDEGSA